MADYALMTSVGLERPPAHLSWKGIVVEVVKSKTQSVRVLHGLQGEVKPGSFLAIMGPSGAGKTTLLNVLSQRYLGSSVKRTEGEVCLNGVPIERLDYKRIAAFVPQDDVLLETLSVRECVQFSASMMLDVPEAQRNNRIEKILGELGLIAVADTVIGNIFKRGLSGGERKRASIAYELVNDPAVLFLDEPTTGLDSFTAMSIMECIQKQAAKYNRTVIATIHQPNSETFDAFDRLCLLSGGHLCYFGEAKEALEYFAGLNYACPKNYNPADFYMNLLCSDELELGDELSERIQKFEDNINRHIQPSNALTQEIIEAPKQASLGKKFGILLRRTVTNTVRSPVFTYAKLFKTLYFFLVMIMAFWQLETNSRSIRDRGGALYMLMVIMYIDNLYTSITTFQTDKPLFMREYASRKYGALLYYLVYNIVLVPFEVFWTVAFTASVYFVINLNCHAVNFFKCLTAMILTAFAGSTFGLFTSIVAPNVEVASALSPLFIGPFMMTSGLLVNPDDIPDWFFVKYYSPLRYSYEAMYRVTPT
jgi:ABC-type multidrug transport system ATPase subunit